MAQFEDRVKIAAPKADVVIKPKIVADVADKADVSKRIYLYPDNDPAAGTRYELLDPDGSLDSDDKPYDQSRMDAAVDAITATGGRPATCRELLAFAKSGWDQKSKVASIAETVEHADMYGTLCPTIYAHDKGACVGEWVTRFEAMPAILIARDA